MSLAKPITFEDFVDAEHLTKLAYIASINCRWADIVLAGGPALLDAAIINDPTAQITRITTVPIRKSDAGTIVRVRMAYDVDVADTITSPIINMFGITNNDPFERLMNQDRKTAITLTVDPTNDVIKAGFRYTLADILLHSVDLVGSDQLVIGITTAFAASTGTVTNSFIQAKLVN